MPKQIFQRPAPIKHQKIGKQNGSPFGQPDFGRKKGPKLPKAAKAEKSGSESKDLKN